MLRSGEISGAKAAARLVGRDRELALVEGLLDGLVARREGGLFVIRGDVGLGKTTLARAALARARSRGIRAVECACWPGEDAPPMLAISELSNGLGIPHDGVSASERFARYGELLRLIDENCRDRPAMAVVDDVQHADRETQLFLRYISRSLHQIPLLLVLCRRTGGAPSTDESSDDPWSEAAATVELRSLTAEEVCDCLDSYPELTEPVRRRCEAMCGGNPLFLHELARLSDAEPGVVPIGIRHVIQQQARLLPFRTQELLIAAAVLGPAATVAELAAVSGATQVALADLGAHSAGLVEVSDGRVSFRHEIARQALLATTPASSRIELHARAAIALSDADDLSAICRRAHHAISAATRTEPDAWLAVEASRVAADRLVASREYRRAAEMLTRGIAALDGHVGLQPPAEMLIERAEAVLAAGELAIARQYFADAMESADREGAPTLQARAVLGLGGVWVEEQRGHADRAWYLGRVLDSVQAVGDASPVLRARLRMRLLAEQIYQGDANVDQLADVVAEIERLGDDHALGEALSLYHHVMLAPAFADDRLAVADRLVEVAARSGSALHGLFGQCWRTVDLYLVGDPEADRSLAELKERTNALGVRAIQYIVEILDGAAAFRHGDLADAERRAGEAFELGTEVGDADALGYYGGQLVPIRWVQGRLPEIRELLDQIAHSPTLKSLDVAFAAVCASTAAASGDEHAARSWLERVGVGRLDEIPQFSTWIATVAALVEAAWMLQDRGLACELEPLIKPHVALPVRPSLAITCGGPTRRLVGLIAIIDGRLDEGISLLRRARIDCDRLSNRPIGALLCAELGEALVRRGGSEDLVEARELLDLAIEEADAMGLELRATAWRSFRDANAVTAPDRVRATSPATVRLVSEGSWWRLSFEGRENSVPDSAGLRHLAELVSHPNQEITALELSQARLGTPIELYGAGEMVDARARDEYRGRLLELRSELAEAEAHSDVARQDALRIEVEMIGEILTSSTGAGGRSRHEPDAVERARVRVTKAIRRAIDRLRELEPIIGAELDQTIRTGSACSYRPSLMRPLRWQVER